MAEAAIQTTDLTKYYGKARGIIDVNLEVKSGEIFGFIGPNGAGKSTTIRTLLGLIKASSGHAAVLGLDFEKDRTAILQQVGYLPSEVFYYNGMKAGELLNYAASFYHKDCSVRIRELADVMELDLKQKIDDMSLGNRKKVGIVQGLLHDPKLIILDEPTSGLDPLIQRRFFELLQEENRKGATILFSSHILSEVQRICDRAAIIREGRIIKVVDIAEMKRETYKKIELFSPDITAAPDLTGIRNFTVTEDHVEFLFNGDLKELIHYLDTCKLENINISEPSLEDIFLHYYQ